MLLFALFCARFWYLQIHRGADYVRMAQENRLRDERIFAPRGEIYDASGELVAENRTAYGLALVREYCPDISAALAQVSAWTGVPLDRLHARYEQDRSKGRSFDPILLLTDMPFEQVAPIEAETLDRVFVVTHSRRYYPEGEAFRTFWATWPKPAKRNSPKIPTSRSATWWGVRASKACWNGVCADKKVCTGWKWTCSAGR